MGIAEEVKLYKLQFIKNFKGDYCCKAFRKYNIVEGWYRNKNGKGYWVHYTKYGIHFIPEEYVKIIK